MRDQLPRRGTTRSLRLPIAAAALAIAVFVADTITALEIAVGVLNVGVVLMAARFCRARGVVLVASGCVGLVVTSFVITPDHSDQGVANTVICIAAIALTTMLVLQSQAAQTTLHEQASLIGLTHDAIVVRDLDGIVRFWNRGAEELYGWAAEDAVGKVIHDLLKTVHPIPLPEVDATLLRTRRWEGDLVHTRRDGATLIVASRQALAPEEPGKPITVMEINNDVSDRTRAEEEVRKVNQELEQRVLERTLGLAAVNKELEAFAYSVSHDLRSPLRHMGGYAELLQRHASSALDDKSRRYVGMIIDAAKRMGALIDDLLAFSRVGRTDIQMTTVPLEPLVREAVDELRQETAGRSIVWKVGSLPTVRGDRAMLRLAVVNLVSNAVKFTGPRARAEIEVGAVTDNNGERVVFVKDNGVGFNMQYVDKLFGVFQRLHRTEDFEGTGIGLATVQRIVHRHGGTIWAESRENEGATFFVSLP